MSPLFRLLAPGARALALLSLFALSGCSRAQQSPPAQPEAQPEAAPSPTATAEPAPTATATNEAPTNAPTLLAAAPHPTEETNSPDAVIHSPVPPPSGVTLHILVPEGQNPPWLPDTLHAATGAKVEVKTYASDAEVVTAVVGEAPPDLVSVSDRAAAALIAKGALRPLSADVTKGLSASAPEFLHHYFDPKSTYTWPYGYTLLGFAVNPGNGSGISAPVLGPWKMLANFQAHQLSLPDDKELRAALWALAEAKPASSDTPPDGWQKAGYEAAPSGEAGKVWIDTVPKLHAAGAKLNPWKVTVPADGSLIFLYHWAIPAAASVQAAPAEAAFRALADPATAAHLDTDAGLAATQPAAQALVAPAALADATLYPAPHVLNESRFVRPATAAPVAEPVRAATPSAAR